MRLQCYLRTSLIQERDIWKYCTSIFHYRWKNPNNRMVFDPVDLVINVGLSDNADWREHYRDIIEEDLLNMLKPLGKPVTLTTLLMQIKLEMLLQEGFRLGF